MLRSSLALIALAACMREPARTASPSPSPSPSPAPTPAPTPTPSRDTPAPSKPAPEEPSFPFLPKDLRDRGPSLVEIQCPTGTKRVETHGYGETHRHCETPTGTYEGPIVDFSATMIHLRGTHNGVREGIELSANEGGGAVESEFAAGYPVGHYRYRMKTIVVAEGNFDSEGRLDGDWVFRMPVSGQELTRTKFVHGTGSIEIWDWLYSQPKVTARLTCKDGLLDGTQMFHVLSRPDVYDYRVDGEYHRGVADGAYKLTRITDDIVLSSGTFKAGTPTGTWKMVAQHPCLAMMRGGDSIDCIYGTDLPYTCTASGKCTYDKKPAVRGGQDIEPVDRDDLTPPHADSQVRRCELGRPYF